MTVLKLQDRISSVASSLVASRRSSIVSSGAATSKRRKRKGEEGDAPVGILLLSCVFDGLPTCEPEVSTTTSQVGLLNLR